MRNAVLVRASPRCGPTLPCGHAAMLKTRAVCHTPPYPKPNNFYGGVSVKVGGVLCPPLDQESPIGRHDWVRRQADGPLGSEQGGRRGWQLLCRVACKSNIYRKQVLRTHRNMMVYNVSPVTAWHRGKRSSNAEISVRRATFVFGVNHFYFSNQNFFLKRKSHKLLGAVSVAYGKKTLFFKKKIKNGDCLEKTQEPPNNRHCLWRR